MLAANPLGIDIPLDTSDIVVLALITALLGFLLIFFLFRRSARPSARPLPLPEREKPPPPQAALARDPFMQGSPSDHRAAPRRRGNPVAVHVSDAEAKAPPENAMVVDRSVTGLCLAMHRAVDRGAILSVRALNTPAGISWTRVEVKNCRAVEGVWEVGCQFVHTPTWSVRMTFGCSGADHFIGNISFRLILNAFPGFDAFPALSRATTNR